MNAKKGLDGRAEKRRRRSLACNVAEHKAKTVAEFGEIVEEVAAEGSARHGGSGDLEPRTGVPAGWQQTLLNIGSRLEFLFDA